MQAQGQPPQQQLLTSIKQHDGAVWSVQWAHPRFGCIVGSCGYDGRINIYKEVQTGKFDIIYTSIKPETSVNSISFAPHQCGLVLCAGRSDGTISVYARRDDSQWDEWTWLAHHTGVNAVSYASQPIYNAQQSTQQPVHRSLKSDCKFVSGGCDNKLRIWKFDFTTNQWNDSTQFNTEQHHTDWIRDVQWSPSMGIPSNLIASCSDDKSVCIWYEDTATQIWSKVKTITFNDKVWKLSWSVMGNILAVAQSDNIVTLWKENSTGEWINISSINDTGSQSIPSQSQPAHHQQSIDTMSQHSDYNTPLLQQPMQSATPLYHQPPPQQPAMQQQPYQQQQFQPQQYNNRIPAQ